MHRGTMQTGYFPLSNSSSDFSRFRCAPDHTTRKRRHGRGFRYVRAFQAAHATMTISAAPASKSPTGLVAVLREVIGASPLLCLISRIIEMRIVREKVSDY
jgi:hypothetical protein